MTKLRVFLAILSLLIVAAPAGAQDEVNGPCTVGQGQTPISSDAPFEETVATPVGAADLAQEDVATFLVDLEGVTVGERKNVVLTLTYDNPLSDYDLLVDGDNQFSSDNPEIRVLSARHCQTIDVQTNVFVGLPIDQLTVKATVAS